MVTKLEVTSYADSVSSDSWYGAHIVNILFGAKVLKCLYSN